ncbi:PIN domain-like protein [Aureobasidium sp. EXF-10727]|nr:PIN domain-like protein [Aureobasidium sp. EXF-10727]
MRVLSLRGSVAAVVMGVTGLWTVVQPCARPIKIETLNKKRLAVDASIWIYQFLKAVRDKDGNALRNSHVVGFFRRICKLLYFGIKPVFVFDGGAPALKRATINARKQRREGRREDATRTAGKLLALQMQRIAEEEENNRKRATHAAPQEEEEPLPDNLVYADEVLMNPQERQQNKAFRKKDQYHLPDLGVPLSEMGAPNDPRIMSLEELENYARQFDTGEDINVYDFSKIDFDGPFFLSLPPSDRYNILNAARLRSRLRMGYSKDQLDTMFPDRMAFSKFQIERVTERNDLTQRLMNLNGMNDDLMFGLDAPGRVAGERGREYVLVKNDGVEGGWALGVVTGKNDGVENKPIDVDAAEQEVHEAQDEDEDDDFEDVPIEGLNRLPKTTTTRQEKTLGTEMARRRQAFYRSKRSAPRRKAKAPQSRRPAEEAEGLFVEDDQDAAMEVDNEDGSASDDEELQRAIAMSMQNEDAELEEEQAQDKEEKKNWFDKFQQSRADEGRPIPRGGGLAIAHIVNSRAGKAVPVAPSPNGDNNDTELQAALTKSRNEATPKSNAFGEESDDSEDDMDFQAALAESRKSKYQSKQPPKSRPEPPAQTKPAPAPKNAAGFEGPLPFEKLDLGSSLLGKKKMQKAQEEMAGGFERDDTGPAKKDKSEPLPPWFDGDLGANIAKQKALERDDWQKTKAYNEEFQFAEVPPLGRHSSREIIDLDLEESQPKDVSQQVIDISDEEEEKRDIPEPADTSAAEQPAMGDLADRVRAVPPTLSSSEKEKVETSATPVISRKDTEKTSPDDTHVVSEQAKQEVAPPKNNPFAEEEDDEEDEMEWEQVDNQQTGLEKEQPTTIQSQAKELSPTLAKQPTPEPKKEATKSPSPDFENVDIPDQSEEVQPATDLPSVSSAANAPGSVTGTADQNLPAEPAADEFGYYSDSEDDELLRQLATETEEHARFASALNHKTQQQNVEEYERELKQLRSQQKKDRRDADEVTHVMIQECQQLLKLFGLPYITAPMEAEAQCAELVTLGLVDGIVTDDSDCFLFGGTRIYKNMFNQAKFVECYLTTDFEKEFDLTRQKMIGIAQLLGSDYTEGLPGVGPVTALEILSEFPDLKDFRDWYNAVQMNQIPKSEDAANPFRKKFRRQATKLFLPSNFPDPRVETAYLQPEVDSDPSAFQWGVPDLSALRSFLMATIGWNSERTDEVLVPVIKDMNRRQEEGTQANITAFFDGGIGAGAYAPRKRIEQGSKRMGSALDRMAREAKKKRKGGAVEDEEEYTEVEKPAPKKKAKRNSKRSAAATASADV